MGTFPRPRSLFTLSHDRRCSRNIRPFFPECSLTYSSFRIEHVLPMTTSLPPPESFLLSQKLLFSRRFFLRNSSERSESLPQGPCFSNSSGPLLRVMGFSFFCVPTGERCPRIAALFLLPLRAQRLPRHLHTSVVLFFRHGQTVANRWAARRFLFVPLLLHTVAPDPARMLAVFWPASFCGRGLFFECALIVFLSLAMPAATPDPRDSWFTFFFFGNLGPLARRLHPSGRLHQ